jgi:hypothetical protein
LYSLNKVFFSDDGSTALEVALKLAYEFTRRTRGASVRASQARPAFSRSTARITATPSARFRSGTLISFTKRTAGCCSATDKVMSPYCYRCPFNRAKPERADAREYRKCNWECVGKWNKIFRAEEARQSLRRFRLRAAHARRGGNDSATGRLVETQSPTSPAPTARCSSLMK